MDIWTAVAFVIVLAYAAWCGVARLVALAREIEELAEAESDTPDTSDDVTEGR